MVSSVFLREIRYPQSNIITSWKPTATIPSSIGFSQLANSIPGLIIAIERSAFTSAPPNDPIQNKMYPRIKARSTAVRCSNA